jgi:phenylacetate-coenzyme A ligase PaaK-like adenylate-forming protein
MGYRITRLQDFTRAARESRALLERERWPRERLERRRRERLSDLLRHAAERSPFWRERIRDPTAALQDLPITTKGAALRDRVERAFGVRPYDFYGATEGLYGHECPEHRSMHLFDDMCVVENVDDEGRPVPPGEPGARLLVTNLFNRALPLIRFEVGDRVTVDSEPCPCGRSLLRVRALEGRAEDVLRLGGVTVDPLEFALVTADPDVREFQVVQEGDGLRLRVAALERSPGGKLRMIVAADQPIRRMTVR